MEGLHALMERGCSAASMCVRICCGPPVKCKPQNAHCLRFLSRSRPAASSTVDHSSAVPSSWWIGRRDHVAASCETGA
eukprot:scaffold2452_cov23-Tisochrysis_lutea.AAC.1